MNFYPHHIGDYRAGTAHLTNEEDLAYRRLLEMYYDTERAIPLDTQWVSRRLRVTPEALQVVYQDFFVKRDDGYHHERCDLEIAEYVKKADIARANGRKGGRRKAAPVLEKNPAGSPSVATDKPKRTRALSNQKPVTSNQEPVGESTARGTRLPADFELPAEWAAWCRENRSDLNPVQTFAKFKDFWVAKAGKDGAKLNWAATWRNWCRAEKAGPGSVSGGSSAGDPDSVASIQAEGIALGIGPWDEMKEQWYSYKARVRGTAKPKSLGDLEKLAQQRQAA